MRHSWEFGPTPPDDQESLQTDVMRFIAILGLCLAAIFSLVNAAEREQAQAPEPAAVEHPAPQEVAVPSEPQVTVVRQVPQPAQPPRAKAVKQEPQIELARQAPQSVQQPQVTAVPQVRTAPPPEPAAQESAGFTLQFESPGAMQVLLASGLIEVFASAQSTFWKLNASSRLEPATAPKSFYAMHAATLPDPIRQASRQLGERPGLGWGVTLPQGTAVQISRLMQGRSGGDLVIDASGAVSLAP